MRQYLWSDIVCVLFALVGGIFVGAFLVSDPPAQKCTRLHVDEVKLPGNLVVVGPAKGGLTLRAVGSKQPFLFLPVDNVTTRGL